MTWSLVLVFSLSLVLSSVLMIRAFTSSSMTSFDLHLFNHAIDLSASIDTDFLMQNENPSIITRKKSTHQMLPFHRSFLQISTLEGIPVSRSANLQSLSLPIDLMQIKKLSSTNALYQTISSEILPIENDTIFEEFRLISTLVVRPPLPPLLLQVAAPLTVVAESANDLKNFLIFMIPITMFIAIFFGVVFSNQALNPMDKMITQARRIEQGELSERIPVPTNDPELSNLASTLNQLLDRLIKMISTQQRFIADASHQLKTPLAIMKIQVEKKETVEQLNRLIRLTENLITLTQVDVGQDTHSFHEFRLDEMLLDVTQSLQKIALQKSVRINTNFFTDDSSDIPFTYIGDSELLRHLATNIIENAIKYSNEGSTVFVELKDKYNQIQLSVKDTGPGIPEEERSRIFDRFYRGKATALKTTGSGLGLSIAQSIAELHHGSIHIESNQPSGVIFIINLPKQSV